MTAHADGRLPQPLPPPLPPPSVAPPVVAHQVVEPPVPVVAPVPVVEPDPVVERPTAAQPVVGPGALRVDRGDEVVDPTPPGGATIVDRGDTPAAAPVAVGATARAGGRPPSLARVTWSRFVVDLKVFVRNGQSVGFTLMFPVMMLFLFASIFSGTVEGTGVTESQLYVAGLIGSSAIATGFVNTAIGVAFERERGELKRLAGTPMPKAAFFLGRGMSVLVMTAAQVVVLLVIGMVFYDLSLPSRPTAWLTFFGVLILGTLGSTLLGLAVGGRVGNAKAAPAVVNLPFVFLQFISGVFIPFRDLPENLRTVSAFFPLRWLAQGMRSVFLPETFVAQEPSGSWQHPLMWAVLVAWSVVGLAVCVRWFRWVEDERGGKGS